MAAIRDAVSRRREPALLREPATEQAAAKAASLSTLCFTPMALAGPLYAGPFGLLAHAFISSDYESRQGVVRGVDAYLDDGFAGPIDPRYAAFVIAKNPGLSNWGKVFLATTTVQRPDVVLHDATRREFEEFKPNSIPGVLDGLNKVGVVATYMSLLSLPYAPGSTYRPTPSIPILSTSVRGTPVEFSLRVRRAAPGLITYEYCIRTDWAKVALAAAIAAILIVLAIIFRGRLPLPTPTPTPIPVPAL